MTKAQKAELSRYVRDLIAIAAAEGGMNNRAFYDVEGKKAEWSALAKQRRADRIAVINEINAKFGLSIPLPL